MLLVFPPLFVALTGQLEPAAAAAPILLLPIPFPSLEMSKVFEYVKYGLRVLEDDLIEGVESTIVTSLPFWNHQLVSNKPYSSFEFNKRLTYNLEKFITSATTTN